MVVTDPIMVALDRCRKLDHLSFEEKFALANEIVKQWEICSQGHARAEQAGFKHQEARKRYYLEHGKFPD